MPARATSHSADADARTTSRRRFIGGAGVAVAAAGVVACSGSTGSSNGRSARADVIVVGAGLAGLSAAHDIEAAGKSVIVLEANDRVGGRTWTEPTERDAWVDMGAQWVGPTQDRVLALIDRLGLKTFPFYKQGRVTLVRGGERTTFDPAAEYEPLPITDAEVAAIRTAWDQLDALAETVPTDAPWQAPDAAGLDSVTVETWMGENLTTAETKFVMRELIWNWFAAEPRDVSLLHLLLYVHAGGGVDSLETNGIALRVENGTQQMSELLAEQLGPDEVLRENPVESVDQTGDDVVVTTPNGTFTGSRVIVAVPPALAGAIAYDPLLPGDRAQLTQRVPMGSSIKCHAVYPSAFWRGRGLSGAAFAEGRPIGAVVDTSPPDGTPGILAGFYDGQAARDFTERPDDEIKTRFVEALADYFGPEADDPTQVFVANWPAQPWARGCFAGFFPTGVWTGYPEVIRKPVDRIHWAGTETATKWYAYMDGAVRSGERAAAEVVEKI